MSKQAKRRSESFWGIHTDFHAKPEEGIVVGETLKEEDIRELCETLKPDFIQIDCKGHPGWTSYPSKMCNAMPNFKGDPLKVWRKVTRECGVALYMHFSGVVDVKYCTDNPKEGIMLSNGENFVFSTRLDGKYLDEYFLPQISELVENYDIDGVWVDGDCWAIELDYHPDVIKKFEEETGISLNGELPTSEHKHFKDYIEYARVRYRRFLNYYVDKLHEKYPNLQVCSNWAFSDHMPEKICAKVDFISGDLHPLNCVNSARYAARMLAKQGIAWDLMSSNSRFRIYGTPLIPAKNPIQVIQEAAAVISVGGAFQQNVPQFKDGSPDLIHFKKLKPLAEFIKEREPYCFKGKYIPQVALFIPSFDRFKEMTRAYSREGADKFMGLIALLCDSSQSVEVISEEALLNGCEKYPLIIVPELYAECENWAVKRLYEYAQNGGSVLLVGNNTAKAFAKQGFPFNAKNYEKMAEVPNFASYNIGHIFDAFGETRPHYFSMDKQEFGVVDNACQIDSDEGEAIAKLHCNLRDEGVAFAKIISVNKGKIGVIGADIGTQYLHGSQSLHRKLVTNILEKMYEPLVKKEEAKGFLEINCLEKDGRLMIQLLNANGEHRNMSSVTEDYIPPVTDIKLSIKSDTRPKAILLHPEENELEFEYKNERAYFSISKLEMHSVVELVK